MSSGDRSNDGDRSDGEGRSDGGDDRSEGATEDDPFGDGPFGDGPTDEAGEADEAFGAPDADEVDDPFAELGEGVEESAGTGSNGDGTDAPPRGDPEPGAPADDPFAELDVDAGDETAEGDPFESMGTGRVGEEDVWEALDEEASVGADATEFDAGGEVGGAGTATPGTEATGDEHVVDKRSYCQRFLNDTATTETACTHEGTEIVESVDFSQFRVRDCPMVDAEDPAFDEE